jgi:formate dehydrogenase major subunit
VPGLGTSFGRGGATTALQDLSKRRRHPHHGLSMAENHPVGFQWVMEAPRARRNVDHVDPRFNRTSAMADLWVPLRAGSDIVFLGALVRHAIEQGARLSRLRRALHQRVRAARRVDEGHRGISTASSPAGTRSTASTTRRAGSTAASVQEGSG